MEVDTFDLTLIKSMDRVKQKCSLHKTDCACIICSFLLYLHNSVKEFTQSNKCILKCITGNVQFS